MKQLAIAFALVFERSAGTTEGARSIQADEGFVQSRRGRSPMSRPLPHLQLQKRCACGQPAVSVKTAR